MNVSRIFSTSVFYMLLAAQAFLILSPVVEAQNSMTEIKRSAPMDSSSVLDEKGHLLRSAIDQKYTDLSSKHLLKTFGNGPNNISDIFIKYIHRGSTISDAEKILRAAGFEIGVIEPNPIHSGTNMKLAKIDQYASNFIGKTSVVVVLEAADPTDWNKVGDIHAEIIIKNL